jgi:hypothetical protein
MAPNGLGGVQSTDFDGNLDTSDAGTTGWAMNAQRAAFGELILRPGSIGNDSLTNPVSGEVRNVTGTGFALAVSFVELAGADVVVPDGFTTLLAKADADVFAYNPNTAGGSNGTGGDAIYSMVQLGSQQGKQKPVSVSGSGGYQTSYSGAGFQFTGLTPGQTLRLSCFGSSAYQSFAANANNNASVSALLLWLR